MSDDIGPRLQELHTLHADLSALVRAGRYRHAAEIAGALEIELDALRASLRRQRARGAEGEPGPSEALRRWNSRTRGRRNPSAS